MDFPREQESKSGGRFLDIKDQDTVRGVFRGKPYEFFGKFEGGRTVQCNEDDPAAKWKFRINFIINENGAYVAKIWEKGWKVYKQLKALNKEYPLESTFVSISRSGSEINDTVYTILPARESKVEHDVEKQLAAVKLLELSPKGSEVPFK